MSEVAVTELTTTWQVSHWSVDDVGITVIIYSPELGTDMTFHRKSLGIEMMVTGGERKMWRWANDEPLPRLSAEATPPMRDMLDALVLGHPSLGRIAHIYGIFIPESQVECNR